MIEEAFYELVTSDVTMSGLIGTRLYPNFIPQDATLPACAYQVISSPRAYTHQGQSEVAMVRMQVTITAASYNAAKGIGAALRGLLSGFCGTVGSGCDFEVYVFGIFFDNEYDGYSLETNLTTVRQDYAIHFREE
jgi:hypothetical protein